MGEMLGVEKNFHPQISKKETKDHNFSHVERSYQTPSVSKFIGKSIR